jgi:N-acetylglucosamine-6-sulfatase
MDGESFLPLAEKKDIPWRDKFLYVYYWEKNFPQTPTTFSLRSDRYKYITYYGLWDSDELYDLKADPEETNNLLYQPKFKETARKMENELYAKMADLGGMEIPLNKPKGGIRNIRLRERGGEKAADFPKPLVKGKPTSTDANRI